MDNSFFFYSNQKLIIERLHLCTWDVGGKTTYIELGIEILNDESTTLPDEVVINAYIPFEINDSGIKSLHGSLIQEKYTRYIFNDIISSADIIDEDASRGKVIHFKKRNDLAILPAKWNVSDNHQLEVEISKHSVSCNLYIRLIIEINTPTLAVTKNGIAKNSYLFDFKVNERRNMPESLVSLINANDILSVRSVFLFHSVPDNYNIDFYDSNKFKSVRKLEGDVFAGYTGIQKLKEDNYIILFNKESDKETYSFYTCFSDEVIGTKQILLAIGANTLCSLLFAIPGFRISWKTKGYWLVQFPWEWIIAIIIVVVLFYFIRQKK